MVFPSFEYEAPLWKQGYLVAGVDEVGRGSLAGPVAAGCVIFSPFQTIPENIYINDSKKLLARTREAGSSWIQKTAFSYGFGLASQSFIDQSGIVQAIEQAIAHAIRLLTIPVDLKKLHILIDGAGFPNLKKTISCGQTSLIHGDQKSYSIAAASIFAKVKRDMLMNTLGTPGLADLYGWATNKGYGTRKHVEALKKYGASIYHRKSFIRKVI